MNEFNIITPPSKYVYKECILSLDNDRHNCNIRNKNNWLFLAGFQKGYNKYVSGIWQYLRIKRSSLYSKLTIWNKKLCKKEKNILCTRYTMFLKSSPLFIECGLSSEYEFSDLIIIYNTFSTNKLKYWKWTLFLTNHDS